MRLPQGVVVCWTILHVLLFRGESFVLSANVPTSAQRQQQQQYPQPPSLRFSGLRNNSHNHYRGVLYARRGGAEESEDDDDDDANAMTPADKKSSKNHIAVSSQIDLPFSAEIAFDAFSDLPRQSTWSPWLQSVEYIEQGSLVTKWTMKSFLGISYSWKAVHTRLERPYVIEWESCQGLKNWGRVEFVPSGDDANTTAMRLTLTFVAPRLVARFFRRKRGDNREGGLSHMVQTRIVGRTLRNFRRVVLTQDVPQKTQLKQQDKELATAALGPPHERYKSIVKDKM